jgi:hypothetical protein
MFSALAWQCAKQLFERDNIDRLHEMVIKTRFAEPQAIFFLAPAGERDQEKFARQQQKTASRLQRNLKLDDCAARGVVCKFSSISRRRFPEG